MTVHELWRDRVEYLFALKLCVGVCFTKDINYNEDNIFETTLAT